MFGYISSLFEDPRSTLIFFLLAFPGRLLAISAHEYAHAWMADRCGDPTARMMGRLTLNPLRHLDLMGALMMLLLGFVWARPVPVNPRNYRNYRRDDLKVSLAGVTMNLILTVAGFLAAAVMAAVAARPLGGEYGVLVRYAASLNPEFVTASLGRMSGYIYQMLSYFVYTNISLALFNLLPVPPLDGYHVLNDLLLRRNLFATAKVQRIAMGAMLLLMFSGLLGQGLSYLVNGALSGLGWAVQQLFQLIGVI